MAHANSLLLNLTATGLEISLLVCGIAALLAMVKIPTWLRRSQSDSRRRVQSCSAWGEG